MSSEDDPRLAEIEKYKEILFGQELRQLKLLTTHVAYHQSMIGSDDKLQSSIAKILAGAMREAEVENHEELSAAISPLVIREIRQEIRNSKGELAEAMYPLMGRLMSSYVTSNLRRFIQETNQQLEKNLSPRHIYLRIKSLATGIPYRDLLLAQHSFVKIQELLLINRETGLPVDHWQAPDEVEQDSKRQDPAMIGSMLSAINQFASETFGHEEGELRKLDIGKSCIYLRTTPLHLLAIKCSGQANRRLEQRFDHELLRLLEQNTDILFSNGDIRTQLAMRSVLPRFANRLNNLLYQEIEAFELTRKLRTPVYAATLLAGITLFGTGWVTTQYVEARSYYNTTKEIHELISSHAAFVGFPISIRLGNDGKTAYVSGLSPSQSATDELIDLLQGELSEITIVSNLIAIVPFDHVKSTLNNLTDLNIAGLKGNLEDITKDSLESVKVLARKILVLEQLALSEQGKVLLRNTDLKQEVSNLKSQLHSLVSRLKPQDIGGAGIVRQTNLDDVLKSLKHLDLPDAPDFNDERVRRNLTEAQKLKLPKHLQVPTLGQVLGGQPAGGSSGTGGQIIGGNSATGGVVGNTLSTTTGIINNTTDTLRSQEPVRTLTNGLKSTTGSLLGRK